MKLNNKWRYGKADLRVPPLPTELRQATGCLFQEAVFEGSAGSEVFLAILEPPGHASAMAAMSPFKLFCKKGLGRTNHGLIIFIIWQVAAQSSEEAFHEQFLNPRDIETIRLLSALGQQTHLKALVVESTSSIVVGWFEFENIFGFDDLVGMAARSIGHEPQGNFAMAMEEFMAEHPFEEMMRL